MKHHLRLALLLIALQSALADDFKTVDGREYKNVTVSRVEPDGIVVTFSGGIVKLPFTELSPEIQKKYGYDLELAAKFQKQTYQADIARARQLTAANEKRRKELEDWSRSHPQQQQVERPSVATSMHGTMLDERPVTKILIYGTVINVVKGGVLVSVRETNAFGTERIPRGAPVLLLGNFPGFYDRDRIQATGSLAGPVQYNDVIGSRSTARALENVSITKLVEFPPNVR